MTNSEAKIRRDFSKENNANLVSLHYYDVTLYTETTTIMVSSLISFPSSAQALIFKTIENSLIFLTRILTLLFLQFEKTSMFRQMKENQFIRQ